MDDCPVACQPITAEMETLRANSMSSIQVKYSNSSIQTQVLKSVTSSINEPCKKESGGDGTNNNLFSVAVYRRRPAA
ncbi:MAG TPA: hypothetical protein VF774_04805, partial [Pseudoduganella sp.]